MNTVTLGGLAVGASLLVLSAIRWWFRDGHQPAAAVPYLLATAYGMLAILTTGGLLGGSAGVALWGANGLGDLSLVYGVGGTTTDVTRANQVALSPGGYVIVLLLTVVIVGLWKWAGKVPNGKLAAGIGTGVCLGLSGTIAGAAAVPLASAVNAAGVLFTQAMQ
ncbi:hypothetical protein [Streptomyces sp. 1331.2]|uniref:hypothetical protein n=1 Tax=Streptomyces sp. 1331.2 TaxID=1938835 RepID=UPI000BDD17CB|nr:hypothetical protein [Streptomyces sp. 1331.2]SOB84222.1 hypothetical protein SAMN06272789_4467 [Streptomyces sp. 1331.2]